ALERAPEAEPSLGFRGRRGRQQIEQRIAELLLDLRVVALLEGLLPLFGLLPGELREVAGRLLLIPRAALGPPQVPREVRQRLKPLLLRCRRLRPVWIHQMLRILMSPSISIGPMSPFRPIIPP